MTYIDYMDLAVCCSRKAVKLNHSHTKFAGWRRRGCWGTKEVYVLVFQTSNNFLVVDGLVFWLRCLAGKIVVIHIISMWDMQHNLLCNWWFSRLAKFLDWKDIFRYFYYHFGQRVIVHLFPSSLSTDIPPNLQGGGEKGDEGPRRYIDL